jgi:DNA-binding CsgD family transcriptional regulator
VNGGRYERRAELAYETGDFAEGDRYLALFLDAYRREGGTHLHRFQMLPRAIATRAHVTGQQEHLEVAREIAEAILSSPSSSPLNIAAALWNAGLVAAERGERSRAEACYRRIEATLGKQRNEGSHRARALIAMAAGDAAAARGHFEKALEPAYRKVSPPSYAWACVDLAESFGDDAFPGQPDRLRALLAESRDIARELGMRPLAHRASALLARHAPGGARPPAGLSPRELEVLRHLALGKTNQEISRDLAISEHTVAHHLTSLFAKIRVTNRVDAATWAVRRGL